MNYIPGFTNYLEASVPAYANGGAIMDDPRQAAVMPMTQEAVAPNYLSGLGLSDAELASLYALSSSGNFNQGNYGSDFGSLDNVYGMNFGSDLGSGGSGGGLYKVNPYMQTFQAPLSDKGNSTASAGGGIDVKSPTQTFRLLDKNTGEVVYEGVGYEGAQEAINRASALTAEQGAKAQWQIQTPNSQQESGYSVVANEKRSQSTVGDIASFALPIAMAIATAGASLPAQMAAAGLAGAAGAGLAGKNPLKAGLISAGTAGLMGGSGANEAIGKAVGSVGGALAAKTTEEVAKTAAEKAAEQIIVTGLSKAAQGAGSAIGNTLLSQGVKSGLSSVTGYKTPAEQYAQQPTQQPTPYAPINYGDVEPIVVTGGGSTTGLGGLAGLGGGITASLPALGGLPMDVSLSQATPTEQPKTAEEIEAEKNPITVTGAGLESLTPDELLAALGGVGGLAAATAGGGAGGTAAANDIVVTGSESLTPDELLASLGGAPTSLLPDNFFDPASTDVNKKLTAKDIADYLRLASLGVSTASGLLGGDKGGGSGGTIPVGMGGLSSLFNKQLPPSTLLGGAGGGALPASTLAAQGFRSPQNYYRYGYGPEQSFFDYATQGAPNTSRAYTGYEGSTAEDAFAPQPVRLPPVTLPQGALPQVALPQPITTPVPNNPAAPSMYLPDTTRFARGGFAVEGAGDGRDDKIPALLSDGEYVFDAETVALLGNGSNKAGAKLLDSFRVKVRKQKGKKLARGKFSDNAKRPEQYMAGGPA
jgi:hypothetical protein